MDGQSLTADFLLPPHLIVEVLELLEEVVDLAALVVPLSGAEDPRLGLLSQVLAYVGHGEDYLFHGTVMADDLQHVERPY